VTLSTGTSGATIRYTLDGRDPADGAAYNGAFVVSTGTTTVRAVATKSCMANSEGSSATFVIGVPGGDVPVNQASLHVGNSLTDTIDGYMAPVASSGGFNLDYARYTVPGIGTWVYSEQPSGGFGVANVQNYVKSKKLDHISFQPFPNMPCAPFGHSDGTPANERSDAVNIDQAWRDAYTVSPNVQMWVYETWPAPQDFTDCITGGSWLRDPSIWNPAAPNTWDEAEINELKYMEAVRTALISYHPGWTTPYIVPAGRALRSLKSAVEAGQFPGVASGNFFPFAFSDNGTDLHLTNEGRYLVSLTFYVSMFKADPRGFPHSNTSLTDAQALALQQIAWDTVRGYAFSGYYR
jgi:hypothetical protein